MGDRYWSPRFGTVLRHREGQVVMMIGRASGMTPSTAHVLYISGPRYRTVAPAIRAPDAWLSHGTFRTSEWERIKRETEE